MKKTFNQLYNFINDNECSTKNILAKFYLYKHKIVSTNRKFVIMENQTHISKLRRKKVSYLKLKKNLIGFNLALDYYVFKHEKSSLLSFELPFIEKNISRNKTDFNSVYYKLYAMNTIGRKHLMVLVRVTKGGFLALSGNIFGFMPKSQAIRLIVKNREKINFKTFQELLKPGKFFLKWHRVQMGKSTIKTRLKVKNFKRKRRLSRSRMFLKNISFVFIFDKKGLTHYENPTRVSVSISRKRLSKLVSKALNFNKPIRYRSSTRRIKRIIRKHKDHKRKKAAMKLCIKTIKDLNGKNIKEKKKVAEFNNIGGRKRNKRFLRFLFR